MCYLEMHSTECCELGKMSTQLGPSFEALEMTAEGTASDRQMVLMHSFLYLFFQCLSVSSVPLIEEEFQPDNQSNLSLNAGKSEERSCHTLLFTFDLSAMEQLHSKCYG